MGELMSALEAQTMVERKFAGEMMGSINRARV
jgi:hypothetical protein